MSTRVVAMPRGVWERDRMRDQTNGITTAQAAIETGLSVRGFHTAMFRARQQGHDLRLPREAWIDARTPLWDGRAVREWGTQRRRGPGRPRAQDGA